LEVIYYFNLGNNFNNTLTKGFIIQFDLNGNFISYNQMEGGISIINSVNYNSGNLYLLGVVGTKNVNYQLFGGLILNCPLNYCFFVLKFDTIQKNIIWKQLGSSNSIISSLTSTNSMINLNENKIIISLSYTDTVKYGNNMISLNSKSGNQFVMRLNEIDGSYYDSIR
jgi:hypothetical protein